VARPEGKAPRNRRSLGESRRKAMQAELEWVRSNPKGRHAKSKARLRQFEEISSSNYQKRNETNELYIPPGERLGELVVEAKGLRKAFGDNLLYDNLSFNLPRGGIVGIIGPNGAGKTTFINLLSGFYPPEEGRVFYRGKDITDLSPAKRVELGITRTFQLVHVFDNLNVYENLGLSVYRKNTESPFTFGMFSSSLRRRSIKQKVEEFLEILELDHLRDETVANLPLGSKKRLEIAMAFVSDPEIIIFDEPFSGLGDQEIDEVVAVLKKHTHDKTLLVIEHKVSKLEEFVDRLAVMHEGEIIACGECQATLNDPQVRECYWKLET